MHGNVTTRKLTLLDQILAYHCACLCMTYQTQSNANPLPIQQAVFAVYTRNLPNSCESIRGQVRGTEYSGCGLWVDFPRLLGVTCSENPVDKWSFFGGWVVLGDSRQSLYLHVHNRSHKTVSAHTMRMHSPDVPSSNVPRPLAQWRYARGHHTSSNILSAAHGHPVVQQEAALAWSPRVILLCVATFQPLWWPMGFASR